MNEDNEKIMGGISELALDNKAFADQYEQFKSIIYAESDARFAYIGVQSDAWKKSGFGLRYIQNAKRLKDFVEMIDSSCAHFNLTELFSDPVSCSVLVKEYRVESVLDEKDGVDHG